MKRKIAADLTDEDLDRLVRLIEIFHDDPEYRIDRGHVRAQWAQLAAEDRGEAVIPFDERESRK